MDNSGQRIRYACTLLRAGEFRLDGGSMFGLIPRTVWSKTVPHDDRGRITVQHNCLLLERRDGGAGPRRVLLEAGTGDKLDDRSREIFAMDGRCIQTALKEAGCDPASVDACIVSHLHFDHAGGLTRRCGESEKPDWIGPASCFSGSRPDHGACRTFPNAKVFVQVREWNDALANRSVMTRTYFADHLEPIRPQVILVDSPPPFAVGTTPDRDDRPMIPLEARCTEVLPGIRVFRCPGHTWGQQATLFEDDRGRTICFTPDCLPTAWHVGQTYSLGYDVEPYTSMITRTWLLDEASQRGWVLMLNHEIGNPFKAVRANGRGWYELVDSP